MSRRYKVVAVRSDNSGVWQWLRTYVNNTKVSDPLVLQVQRNMYAYLREIFNRQGYLMLVVTEPAPDKILGVAGIVETDSRLKVYFRLYMTSSDQFQDIRCVIYQAIAKRSEKFTELWLNDGSRKADSKSYSKETAARSKLVVESYHADIVWKKMSTASFRRQVQAMLNPGS